MRFSRFSLLLFFLLFHISVWAQVPMLSPPPPLDKPVRDAQALQIVQKSVDAMGGASTIGQVQSSIVLGAMAANPGSPAKSGSFVWEAAGSEYRFEGTDPSGKNIFVTGHGNPSQSSVSNSHKMSRYIARAMFVPALVGSVLFRELQDQNYSFRYSGTGSIGAASVVIVITAAETKYPDNVITPQVWYFDSSTGYPLRVEFRTPESRRPANSLPGAFDYSDFRMVSGAIYPFQIALSINGEPLQAFSINSVQVNATVPPSDFDAPAGGAL